MRSFKERAFGSIYIVGMDFNPSGHRFKGLFLLSIKSLAKSQSYKENKTLRFCDFARLIEDSLNKT